MPVKALNKTLKNRSIVVVSAGGVLADRCRTTLEGEGAQVSFVDLPGEMFVEEATKQALDAASGAEADGVVYIPGAFSGAVDAYVEDAIGGCLFALKLAMRLRAARPLDFVCLAGPAGDGQEAEIAQSMRNGALRQMTKVASAEAGPMDPPMTANAVFVSEGAELAAALTHLLGAPQSYVSGITLTLTN
ncbi:MAG: hypothetical protein ACE363_13710 [Alphaproteobacteria bacterium]